MPGSILTGVKTSLKNQFGAGTYLSSTSGNGLLRMAISCISIRHFLKVGDYICKIVTDIVSRYDVDAIHMDDYFYPYPVKGMDFPDDASFARYGGGFTNKADCVVVMSMC